LTKVWISKARSKQKEPLPQQSKRQARAQTENQDLSPGLMARREATLARASQVSEDHPVARKTARAHLARAEIAVHHPRTRRLLQTPASSPSFKTVSTINAIYEESLKNYGIFMDLNIS